MSPNKKYFNWLLKILLSISIIPVVVSIFIAGGIIHYLFSNHYSKQAENISAAGMDKIERTMFEYENIINALTNDKFVLNALTHNENLEAINQAVDLLIAGREDKIDIVLVSSNGSYQINTGTKQNLQNISVYFDYGIFREVRYNSREIVVVANSYYNGDRKIVLTMGKTILNKDKILGYVLLNIYEDSLKSLVSQDKDNKYSNFTLLTKENIVVFDTTMLNEGGYIIKDDILWKVLSQQNCANVSIDGISQFILKEISKQANLILITTLPAFGFSEFTHYMVFVTIIVVFLSTLICIMVAYMLSKKIYKPIEFILNSMKKLEMGELNTLVDVGESKDDEISRLGQGFNKMSKQITFLINRAIEENERLKLAEFKALQAQISPHFIYNLLNDIKSLAKFNKNQEIVTVAVMAGKLLRNTINAEDEFTTISESSELITSYLELQNIRFDKKIEFYIEMQPEILNQKIPRLILQPIVENSVIHGLREEQSEKIINIIGKIKGNDIEFRFFDNGVGMSENSMQTVKKSKAVNFHESIGLSNIENRIKIHYGEKYGIKIKSEQEKFTEVIMLIPYKSKL